MRKLIACIAILAMAGSVNACDICGCSSGGNYLGILPQFQKNFIGAKFQYSSFHSTPHSSLSEHHSASDESFYIATLWGRFVLHKHIQLFAFVPYNYNKRNELIETKVHGVGDITLLVNYTLIQKGNDALHSWKHLLQVGGGIKLPTGKSYIVQNGLLLNQNIQLGTGSLDFPLNTIYTIRHKQLGANAELNYKFNRGNKFNFDYGDKMNASVRLFTWQQIKNLSCLPHIGLTYEHADVDTRNHEIIEYTGGHSMLATCGVDLYFGQTAFMINIQKPIEQQLGDGYITSKTRITTNFIYLFKTKKN